MRSHSSHCNTLHIVDILLHLPAQRMEAKGSNQEPRVSHKNRRQDRIPVVVISAAVHGQSGQQQARLG